MLYKSYSVLSFSDLGIMNVRLQMLMSLFPLRIMG